jgi:hypothetical protein
MKIENNLIRILKSLYVAQEVSNNGRDKKLGRGFSTARRLNPYNPLSYIAAIIMIIFAFINGFITFIKESDFSNPFKWN